MSLFDPSPFGPSAIVVPELGGPYRVEVYAPAGGVWIPMERLEPGQWEFDDLNGALDAAIEWLDAGRVLDPIARVVDVDGQVSWSSCGPAGPFVTVRPSERYL